MCDASAPLARSPGSSRTARSIHFEHSIWIGLLVWLFMSVTGVARAQGCDPIPLQSLLGPPAAHDDAFGATLAMTDPWVAVLDPADADFVGPFGVVYLYRRRLRTNSVWDLEQTLYVDGGFLGWMGNGALDMDGQTLLLGLQSDGELGGEAGAAYLFELLDSSSSTWGQVQKLVAPDGGREDRFGASVSVLGEWAVVGASNQPGLGRGRGAVYVYRRGSEQDAPWKFLQKIQPESLRFGDRFGTSVAMEGSTMIVGAPFSDTGPSNTGSLWSFTLEGDTWSATSSFTAPDIAAGDGLGVEVALQGDWLFAGAFLDDELGNDAGAVHVFRRKFGRWIHHQKLLPETGAQDDNFGLFLAAEDGKLIVGDPFVDEKGDSAGTVYTFELEPISDLWLQTSRFFPPDLDEKDFLGPVAISDGIVAAGAVKSLEPGAVYLFSARPGGSVSTYCSPTSGAVPDCAPALETLGAPSASASSTFRLWSRSVPGFHSGLLLYSAGGSARPDLTGSGICLPGTPTLRKGSFWSGGSFGQCDGSFLLDWNAFVAEHGADDPLLHTPGESVHLQAGWFDLLSPGPVAWSDAVAVQLCP